MTTPDALMETVELETAPRPRAVVLWMVMRAWYERLGNMTAVLSPGGSPG